MNNIPLVHRPSLLKTFLASAIIVIALSGCTVTLISSYDENTDKAVTQLQKDIETFFVTVDSQVGRG